MYRLTAVLLVLPCLTTWPGNVVQAQLVQVGPGYVKAPFVRVYTNLDGSSWVRAPFVSVFTPGFGPAPYRSMLPRPEYGRPDLGAAAAAPAFDAGAIADADWRTLKEALGRASARLDRELNSLGPKAAGWKRYLHVETLGEQTRPDNRPPSDERAGQLQQALTAFDTTASTERFAQIAALRGFDATRRVLAELLADPLPRQRRLLALSIRDLHRDLLTLGTGAEWNKYLALPAVAPATGGSGEPLPPGGGDAAGAEPWDRTAWEQALMRFDAVSEDAAYDRIAQLASFQATRDSLAVCVELIHRYAPQEPDADSAAEELPPPAPDGTPQPTP